MSHIRTGAAKRPSAATAVNTEVGLDRAVACGINADPGTYWHAAFVIVTFA